MSDAEENKNRKVGDLLAAMDRGEKDALDQLVVEIYPELKRLAHFQLAKERRGHTLNTTAIVHEAFVRLAAGDGRWNDRAHFMRAAATVMRHLLVDHARKRNAEKRGSGLAALTLEEDRTTMADDSLAVLTLDTAINDIAEIDQSLAQIIEYRYFAGLTVKETAEALGMSVRSVERSWQRARAYLLNAMEQNAN